jgi:hypothetical protein
MDVVATLEGNPSHEIRVEKYNDLTREEATKALEENPQLWAAERRDAAKFIQGQDTRHCTFCDCNAVSYECRVTGFYASDLRADLRNKKRKIKKLNGACSECCNCFYCIRRVVEHVFNDPHTTYETEPVLQGIFISTLDDWKGDNEEDELSSQEEDRTI